MRAPWLVLIFLIFICAVGCKSSHSVAGTYRIEQENNALGEGAEKGELTLANDMLFEITKGSLKLKEGTYSTKGSKVERSDSTGKLATIYKIQGNKLIPTAEGKEIAGWRFVKK